MDDKETIERLKNTVLFKTPLSDKEMGGLELGWFGTILLTVGLVLILGLLVFSMWKW